MPDVGRELLVVLGMITGTVVIHMVGLTTLVQFTRWHIEHLRTPWLSLDRILVPLSMVMGLFLTHALEVFAYASAYQAIGATHGWGDAIFISVGAYSTAGWEGEATPEAWRLVVGFEALNGMLLVGWSTAFLFQTLHRILQTEETHPLPEGAIAEEPDVDAVQEAEVASGIASPRSNGSGKAAP